jgi:hypothetical protein
MHCSFGDERQDQSGNVKKMWLNKKPFYPLMLWQAKYSGQNGLYWNVLRITN